MGVLTLPLPLPLPHHIPLQSVSCDSYIHRKRCSHRGVRWSTVSSQQQQQQEVCTEFEKLKIDKSVLKIQESSSDSELWATSLLRVRSFYDFKSTFGIQDHKKYLAEAEFEALKQRVAGITNKGEKVSCINATLGLSQTNNFPEDLRSSCKFSHNGEDQVVVGTLDVNQCISLPNEITGMKPKGSGAYFARAYLSNVCVANECQRNGLAFLLVEKSKSVAQAWGISDLYVHVAVDNEPAKNLYTKCGFIYESEEPAWQARFLDRPRRLLLWLGLPKN